MYKANGTLDKYKARLGEKGFTYQPGIDFEYTYSPVVIKILMTIIAYMDLELYQMDVKMTFLKG